jgi:N-acetylneuraminic acid mutarotase
MSGFSPTFVLLTIFTAILSACAIGLEPTSVLVYLPTDTVTPTSTLTVTPKPTLTPKPPPGPSGTPTLTPEPWIEIELAIRDVESGEAVVGDVYVVLYVDDKTVSELIEEDVSDITFNIPRASTRADAIFIQIFAQGYLARGVRLPAEVKYQKGVSLEAQLRKAIHLPPPTPIASSTPLSSIPASTSTIALPTSTSLPDPTQGIWRAGAPMPSPARSEMPAITLGEWVYVPGGFGDPARLDRYGPRADQWQTLAPMPAGRHHLMASAHNGQLYIFGGADAPDWTPTDTVWRYDPATNIWTELGRMLEARSAGAAVTLGDKIYIIGGVGGSEGLLEFSPAEQAWQLLNGPSQPREHVSAVAFQGEIWVLGGRWGGLGELVTVEIYNPTNNTWREGQPLNTARAGFAAAVVAGHIMVAGGEVIINGSETLDSLEILAPGGSNWQLGPKLPIPMHGVGGAAFERSFVLPGGSRRAGAIENEGQVQIYQLP